MNAGIAQQSPGPGASANAQNPSGGGGFGGNGGSDDRSSGGSAYANLAQLLQAGSNAGTTFGAAGGRGGGAIDIGAAVNLNINGALSANGGNGQVFNTTSSGGGSGGGIILNAANSGTVMIHATLTANGGSKPEFDARLRRWRRRRRDFAGWRSNYLQSC